MSVFFFFICHEMCVERKFVHNENPLPQKIISRFFHYLWTDFKIVRHLNNSFNNHYLVERNLKKLIWHDKCYIFHKQWNIKVIMKLYYEMLNVFELVCLFTWIVYKFCTLVGETGFWNSKVVILTSRQCIFLYEVCMHLFWYLKLVYVRKFCLKSGFII